MWLGGLVVLQHHQVATISQATKSPPHCCAGFVFRAIKKGLNPLRHSPLSSGRVLAKNVICYPISHDQYPLKGKTTQK